MPWWLTRIFLPLLVSLLVGVVLGIAWWWQRSAAARAKAKAKQADSEAESDRLRLKVSSLKSAAEATDKRIETLESELADAKAEADKIDGLQAKVDALKGDLNVCGAKNAEAEAELKSMQKELNEARAMANDIPRLERELDSLQTKAAQVDRLETEVVALRGRARDLEIDLEAVQQGGRTADLEAELGDLRAQLAAATAAAATTVSDTDADEVSAFVDSSGDVGGDAALDPDATVEAILDSNQTVELTPEMLAAAHAADADSDSGSSETGTGDPPSWQTGVTELGTPGASHVDDLKVIKGIGPVMEGLLNSFGIQTYEQVAAFTSDDIERVSEAISAFPGRIERDDWVGGAQRILDARQESDSD